MKNDTSFGFNPSKSPFPIIGASYVGSKGPSSAKIIFQNTPAAIYGDLLGKRLSDVFDELGCEFSSTPQPGCLMAKLVRDGHIDGIEGVLNGVYVTLFSGYRPEECLIQVSIFDRTKEILATQREAILRHLPEIFHKSGDLKDRLEKAMNEVMSYDTFSKKADKTLGHGLYLYGECSNCLERTVSSNDSLHPLHQKEGHGLVGAQVVVEVPVCFGRTTIDERLLRYFTFSIGSLGAGIIYMDNKYENSDIDIIFLKSIGTSIDNMIRIDNLAHHDELTGLYNRRALENQLISDFFRAQREKIKLHLVFVDLNKFKPINDEYGHEVGDKVLVETGHRLKKSIRKHEVVARYGGDEFVILISGDFDEDTFEKKLRKILSRKFDVGSYHPENGIEASIGFATYDPRVHPDMQPSELVDSADQSMYKNKEGNERT
jgi:diguanylate cyclase (GGDEF)-like protein